MISPQELIDEIEEVAEVVYEYARDLPEEERREMERDANTLYRAANTLRGLITEEVIEQKRAEGGPAEDGEPS